MALVVSGSQLDCFSRCQREHYYGYDLGLTPLREQKRARRLGTAGHVLLAPYYRALASGAGHAEAVDAALGAASWQLEIEMGLPGDVVEEARNLVQLYWAAFNDDPSWMQVLAVEQQYRVQLGADMQYAMQIDLLIRDTRDNTVQLWDHRFLLDFYPEDVLVLEPQMPRYVAALRALGIQVDRAVRNMIRTRRLKGSAPELRLRRAEVPIDPARLAVAARERDQRMIAMSSWLRLPVETRERLALRTFTRGCTWCDFRAPCAVSADGGDENAVLAADYEPNTSYGYKEEPAL